MPIVQMPDGTQVQFPDDMPDDQIRGLILQKFPEVAQQAQPAPAMASPKGDFQPMPQGAALHGRTPEDQLVENKPSALDAVILGAGDMASFGSADEIAAYVKSLFSDDSYGDILGNMRKDQSANRGRASLRLYRRTGARGGPHGDDRPRCREGRRRAGGQGDCLRPRRCRAGRGVWLW
jgi:hypothetical protein